MQNAYAKCCQVCEWLGGVPERIVLDNVAGVERRIGDSEVPLGALF